MTDSKRLTVLKALTDLLKTITNVPPDDPPPEGWEPEYQHDLSSSVVRGLAVIPADMAVPLVSVIEYPQVEYTAKFVGGQRRYQHDWDLMIQGWTAVPEDDTDPTDPCYLLMADVQKALARILDDGGEMSKGPDYMLGGLVAGFEMTPGTVRPADENSSYPCFYLRVRVRVAETVSDPYSLA